MNHYTKKANEIEEGDEAVVELFHGTDPVFKDIKRLKDTEKRGAVFLTDNAKVAGSYTIQSVARRQEVANTPEVIAEKYGVTPTDVVIVAKIADFDEMMLHGTAGYFIDTRCVASRLEGSLYKDRMLREENLLKAANEYFMHVKAMSHLLEEDPENYARKTGGLLRFKVIMENPKVIDMEGHCWGYFKDNKTNQWGYL